MNLREFIQSEIKSQLYLSEASGTLKIEKRKDGKYYWKFTFKSGKVEDSYSGFDSGADAKRDFMYRSKYLSEGVDWKSFYTMAKDTSGYNPSFEKKYGKLLDKPHVKDALDKTKDFNSFMKFIKKFESVNEGIWPKSKLSNRFQFILADELKTKFKGIFYVDGYDLYHNDKMIMRINPDKDSVNSIVNHISRNKSITKIKESVNEAELPKDGSTIKVGNTRVEIKYVGKNKDYVGFNWKGDDGKSNYEETKASDHKDMDSLINTIKDEIRYQRIVVSKRKPESVNEAPSRRSTDFFEDSKHGIAIQKLLKGKWDSKKVEAFLDKLGDGNDVKHARILDFIAGSLGMNIRKYKTLGDMMPELIKTIEQLYKTHNESINESEQLDEKLITFSNRAPYGQVVFMAGGAGSGKGFAIKNFIDSAGFKVRDVDEMKTSLGRLDQLGKFSIDDWFKKYANKLSEKERAHVEEFVLGKGLSISDVASNLKNPNNVAALHYIVAAMGLKDSWLVNMLSGKSNKETLPNLLFDITAKKVGSITEVTKPLIDAGYDSKNIHLIWVLTDYHLAVQQNKGRDRVVPDDILLNTHEGAAKTIWGILTSGLPSGLNGRIDVILNNRENTVTYKDSKGNEMQGAVKGFLSLPVKKQGGGILPEKVWKETLYKWIVDNGPKTIDLSKPLDRQMQK